MPADTYWLDALGGHSIAILARPRPGDWLQDEIESWRLQGVGIVLSMLTEEEETELGLGEEAAICATSGLHFYSFPIPDIGLPPSFDAVHDLTAVLAHRLREGDRLGVHCRMSIGRSSMMAAAVLIETGISALEALRAIAAARGLAVPDTTQQLDWIEAYERWWRTQGGGRD